MSAVITMIIAGSNTNRPTTTVVEHGPYRFTRDPIYLGMFLAQDSLAIAFNNPWLLMTLAPVCARRPLRRGASQGSLSRAQFQ